MERFSFPVSLALLSLILHCIHAVPQVPCYFIFGDSLSDDGNNNYLPTLAKVNYLPYGIDYPQGPTGRFSNGKNIQDVIAENLGFPSPIPPFATATGNAILKGVNYASGGAGIRSETGETVGARIPLGMQLTNHAITISKIAAILLSSNTNESASDLLSKCIYTIDIGSNDYILNYFLPQFYPTSRQYTPQQYAKVLIQQYSQQIQNLYHDGAKKFALFAIGYIGCTPYAVATYGTKNGSACVDDQNQAVQLFNEALLSLVKELNNNISDARFTYINPYGFTATGFITNSSCCEVDNAGQLCVRNSVPCPDRSKYTYWDGVHPTQAINILAGNFAYATTSTSNAYPFNLQSLALQ
ncbi:hypothetical protein SLE2022_150330 [Rubroshorea leprosula]